MKFSGDLTIDFAGRRQPSQGSPIALTKKEFDIVALLAQNLRQIFDRERIYEQIWGYCELPEKVTLKAAMTR